MILTSLLATHASILSCIKSTFAFALASSLIQCSSTTNRGIKFSYELVLCLNLTSDYSFFTHFDFKTLVFYVSIYYFVDNFLSCVSLRLKFVISLSYCV